MFIAPGKTSKYFKTLDLENNESSDWDKAIDIFYSRISSRYLEPTDYLIKEDNKRTPTDRRYGFSILAIDCLLIETLQSFREGLTDTKGKSKVMFVNFLTLRENFRDHFNKHDAENFYYDIRCGILHQAEIMGDSILWSVGMVKGKKYDGTPYLNRTKIHDLVKMEVDSYCKELRNKDNIITRKKFKTKMNFISRENKA